MRLAAALLMIGFSYAASASSQTPLTNFHEFNIRFGENHIPHFASDGRDATITKVWRGNGNAHSYSLFVITMSGGEMDGAWNLVGVDTFDPHDKSMPLFADIVGDNPHTGEDFVTSVRFGRADIEGKLETVLVMAHREFNLGRSIPDPSHARIDIYRLVHVEGGPGTYDQFVRTTTFRTRSMYCNADMALWRELHIALPTNYGGANTQDGCLSQ